jgi:MFS family permease
VSWTALVPDVAPLRGPRARGFRAVFTSRTVAYLGSQAAEVALLVQAQRITGSPLVVGTLGLAELVPLVVFGLYGGVLADRFDRRALMRWCEPGLAACAVLLLLNALLPHPLLWPLYVIAGLMMALASLQRPAFEAATPRIVPRDQLTAAAAIMSLSTNASVLVGSSLGGVLAVSPGPWLVYALDAAGFAVSFVMLGRLPKLPPVVEESARAESAELADGPALREILVGLRYAVSRRDLLGSYLADLAAMVFAYPNAMLPFLAAQLHAPWSTGLMFAAPSAGALAVSATSGWMPRVRRHGLAIAFAAAGWGAAMALVGLAPDVYVALACLAVAGGADECSAVFRDTMWKQSIPDHLRGRMAGIELLSYAAGPPAGQFRSGAVAAVTSVRFSLTSGGLACIAAVAGVVAALPAFRGYSAPLSTPVPRLALVAWRDVQGGIAVEEAERLEPERDDVRGHHRPVLRAGDVVQAKHVPEHHVGVLDGPVGLGPGGQARIVLGLDGEVAAGPALVRTVRRHPERVADDLGPLEGRGGRVEQRRERRRGDELVADRGAEAVGHVVVDDLPAALRAPVVVLLSLRLGAQRGTCDRQA